MMWVRKSYDHPSHAVVEREPVLVGDEYRWRARTVCGRTITGLSGGTIGPAECRSCQRAGS